MLLFRSGRAESFRWWCAAGGGCSGRRANGLRTPPRGMLVHIGPGRPPGGGRRVRQADRLPESIDGDDVATFLADLLTYRDRAIVFAMALGDLRAGEVRPLRLADVDMGLGRVRVFGKGGRARIVPVDRAFLAECASYLREERPPGCATPECFVGLAWPTRAQAMTGAAMRKIIRLHRERAGSQTGASASSSSLLRDRARCGGDRSAGAA